MEELELGWISYTRDHVLLPEMEGMTIASLRLLIRPHRPNRQPRRLLPFTLHPSTSLQYLLSYRCSYGHSSPS